MEQYKNWNEKENSQAKCPIHNIIVSPMINQNSTNYGANRIISSNYTRPSPQIYSPQRQIIQSSNQNISNNYYNYNYNQYSNQNQQQYNNKINNNIQNYNQMNYNYKNDYKNKPTNLNINSDKFINYESSDGVIRGYTNNYSFYVSGSSKIKPKVTMYSKEELVALVAVFAQEGAEVFHRRGFNRLETKAFEHGFNRIEDIISAHHNLW